MKNGQLGQKLCGEPANRRLLPSNGRSAVESVISAWSSWKTGTAKGKTAARRTRAETIRDLNELRMWHLEMALRKNDLWDDDKDGLTGWPDAYGPAK